MYKTNLMPTLQEKSASGSVASFNTALAMPLPSCKIAVNAWQEGSGDPSPDNVRPIHGFSEVNATRAGKNLLKVDGRTYAEPTNTSFSNTNPRTFITNSYCICLSYNNYYNRSWFNNLADISIGNSYVSAKSTIEGSQAYSSICLPVEDLKTGVNYRLSASLNNCEVFISFYKADGTYIGYPITPQIFTIPNETKFTVLFFRALQIGAFGATNIQLEAGSTATAYEPYVTPTIYTIQLGQEVYGGVLDLDSGVLTVTHRIENAKNKTWYDFLSGKRNFYTGFGDTDASVTVDYPTGKRPVLCNMFKWVLSGMVSGQIQWGGQTNNKNLQVDTGEAEWTLTDWNNFINNNDVIFCYQIANPTTIQLTPQEIETLIGNNTIFADTGDTSVVFKDLDIAKRGNFREVFKLPS